MIACYFRVSSDRQTVENQFPSVLDAATGGAGGNGPVWRSKVDQLLSAVLITDTDPATGAERVSIDERVAAKLEKLSVFCESHTGRKGSTRPVFERMKRALAHGHTKLIVWKVTRLGRDMLEILTTASELAKTGVVVVPLHSQIGPIDTAMGRLLWAIQAWYAEMENEEKSEAVKSGLERARRQGKRIGRPPAEIDMAAFRKLAEGKWSVPEVCKLLGISRTTYYRASARLKSEAEGKEEETLP